MVCDLAMSTASDIVETVQVLKSNQAWVKTNTRRLPRAKLRKAGGILKTGDVLSIFHEEACKADAKAFSRLLQHVREIDGEHSTVVMVQVDNETGLLGDSRDGSAAAEKRFSESVPADLLQFLAQDWSELHVDLKANLGHFKAQTKPRGKWTQIFGKGPHTDELFLNQVAATGKSEYPIPLYTNVWQDYVGSDGDNDFPVVVGGGGYPGDYPSGGGTGTVLDVWQKIAPSLDFAPDLYLNDYSSSCRKYRHSFPSSAVMSTVTGGSGLHTGLSRPLGCRPLVWTP
jgi:hypothetical protein